jgi:NAD(P)-dependent dehydrogenase (short-subunit alcohol dehydrogenase family)
MRGKRIKMKSDKSSDSYISNSELSSPNQFRLNGKVAMVTGGAGLLGYYFCNGLAESGASVAVVDIQEDRAREIARELETKFKVKSLGYCCDVSNPNSVRKTVAEIVKDFGRIDILHNNAASKSDDLEAYFSKFEDYDLKEWQKIMAINIDGMFLIAQAVGVQMISQQSGGSIIQTSSIYGVSAPDQRIYEGSNYLGRSINTPAVYSVSKAAVIGLTKYLATYWAQQGIRVNTLTPGGVDTGQNEEFKRRYSARVPMGRMANASEMVGALLYLASDASSYVTGQNIIVDGGLNAW